MLEALEFLRQEAGRKQRFYGAEEESPLDGVIPHAERRRVVEQPHRRPPVVSYLSCRFENVRHGGNAAWSHPRSHLRRTDHAAAITPRRDRGGPGPARAACRLGNEDARGGSVHLGRHHPIASSTAPRDLSVVRARSSLAGSRGTADAACRADPRARALEAPPAGSAGAHNAAPAHVVARRAAGLAPAPPVPRLRWAYGRGPRGPKRR